MFAYPPILSQACLGQICPCYVCVCPMVFRLYGHEFSNKLMDDYSAIHSPTNPDTTPENRVGLRGMKTDDLFVPIVYMSTLTSCVFLQGLSQHKCALAHTICAPSQTSSSRLRSRYVCNIRDANITCHLDQQLIACPIVFVLTCPVMSCGACELSM